MLREPTTEEKALFEVIAAVYLRYGEWPGWAYVEEMLERRGIDAGRVYKGMPQESAVGYSYVFPRFQTALRADNRIGLTVAALAYVDQAKGLVDAYLNLLDALGTVRANSVLDPFATERPKITRGQMQGIRIPGGVDEKFVIAMLHHEPATWLSVVSPDSEEWESIELAPELRRFAGIASVDDYLERLDAWIGPAPAPSVRQEHSPFSLASAFDYLDVVWQLHFHKPLVDAPGIERSARLATPANGPDEADSRLSALAEVLKSLRVPGVPGVGGGHVLMRLAPFLEQHLPAESQQRVRDAVAVLDAARSIRAAAQHAGARSTTVSAYATLGLDYPVSDWSQAWSDIAIAVADALDAIREELRAAPDDDN